LKKQKRTAPRPQRNPIGFELADITGPEKHAGFAPLSAGSAPPASIAAAVVEDISELSHYPAAHISAGFVLAGPPLFFSDFGLTALAQRLYTLIQSQNPSGRITIGEVRAPGLTVTALVKLVVSRCGTH